MGETGQEPRECIYIMGCDCDFKRFERHNFLIILLIMPAL